MAFAGRLVPYPLVALLLLCAACGPESGPVPPPPIPAEELQAPLKPVPPETEAEKPVEEEPAPRAIEREIMVARQIEARGVRDPYVLAAMRRVPRHLFVPEDRQRWAYADRPLSIGWDQTISQPYIVASMTEEARVRPGSKVLEIGTGSGYQAAILAAITDDVYTVEIKEPLVERAHASLEAAGFRSVTQLGGDGYFGWKDHEPFDAIIVTCAAPHIPPSLVAQLAPGGRMVIPVGAAMAIQDLMLVTKDEDGTVRTKSLYPVRFVPLTGAGAE
jgi:protein-L-isoaspartate(D-aspartate) O-methyltransferase